jgi:hypothetical protein
MDPENVLGAHPHPANGNGARGSAVMDEATFRGPSPAANLVQVDAAELERLRRIKDAAWDVLTAMLEAKLKVSNPDLLAAIDELRDAIAYDLR